MIHVDTLTNTCTINYSKNTCGMMRSNSVTKVAKPPPPIPPRPSKTLVAEALAKTRGWNRAEELPPSPPHQPDFFLPVTKSQSTVLVPNKKIAHVQRSTSNSHEKKEHPRTVIFQSTNFKTSKIDVKLMRNGSCNKDLTKTNHLNDKNNEVNRIKRNNSFNNKSEKNHVNALIDEMFASILDIPDGDDENAELPEARNENVNVEFVDEIEHVSHSKEFESPETNGTDDNKMRVQIDDKQNHELLISELQNMHKDDDLIQRRISKRQRLPSLDKLDLSKIQQSDWVEVNNGQEVRLSRCEIIIDDCDIDKDVDITTDVISRLNMSSYGLPPLPKSLSGFSLNPQTPSRITPPISGFSPGGHAVYPSHPRLSNGSASESQLGRNSTNLDNQLAILRREMYSLRQLDLSLLSQLWTLNESIQEFRQMLQEQDDRGLSPPSPSPSPSSCDDGETDEFFSPSPLKLRPAPPPPPLRRTSNSSSANSSEYGTV